MKKLSIFCLLFVSFVFADSTKKEQKQLEFALLNSQIFEQNITSQVGSVSYYTFFPKYTNSFFIPFGSSNLHFRGIGQYDPSFKPKVESVENSEDSPAFIFTFEKKGDSFSIGGDIKGIDMDYLNEYFKNSR